MINMDYDFNPVIQNAIEGDERAFQKIYDKYYKQLYYYALKLSNGNVADAQDAVQDAFFEIHKSIGKLKSPESFKLWSSRILYSKCTKIFYKNKAIAMAPEDLKNLHAKEDTIDFLPDECIRFANDQELIHAFVERLPQKQKDVIMLMYFGQFSLQEIAEIMDAPLGTIKSRSKVARDSLRKMIETYEIQNDCRVGFRLDTLGTVLAAYYAAEFIQVTGGIVMGSTGLAMAVKGWLASMLTPIATVGLSAIVVVSGYMIIEKTNHQAIEKPISNISSQNIKPQEEKNFTPIVYQNTEITDAQSAYYKLRDWAYDKEHMVLKTQQEISEIKVVYEQLKKFQGTYWDMLMQDQWNIEFENL